MRPEEFLSWTATDGLEHIFMLLLASSIQRTVATYLGFIVYSQVSSDKLPSMVVILVIIMQC